MVAAQFDLTGRTALVTGGGSGLGAAMAMALSDAGASIVLVGRREDRLKATLGSRDGAIAAIDLVRQDAEKDLSQHMASLGIEPDIIVNAAGINPRLSADDISSSEWQLSLIHI